MEGVRYSLFGGISPAVSGASICFPPTLEATKLPILELNPFSKQPSTVMPPLLCFIHKTDTPRSAYVQTWVFSNPKIYLEAILRKIVKTLRKLEEYVYNVWLKKKAMVGVLKKQTSELSALKDENGILKKKISDAISVCPAENKRRYKIEMLVRMNLQHVEVAFVTLRSVNACCGREIFCFPFTVYSAETVKSAAVFVASNTMLAHYSENFISSNRK